MCRSSGRRTTTWTPCAGRTRSSMSAGRWSRSRPTSAPCWSSSARAPSRSSTATTSAPSRETEGMKDGSDAIADWPILNALVNTACGAGWVSVHHGGGVGIGYSLHAGMVVVADGTDEAKRRLELVLTSDPGTGVLRHADASYEEAVACAKDHGIHMPGLNY